jgi:hypothetical protein
MTTKPQSEPHLDADQLTAFAEGALSASERMLCLQHLAQCAHCREIAFLAGASLPSDEHVSAPSGSIQPSWWSRWWPPLSIGAAALAAAAITAVLLHHPHQTVPRTTVQIASEPSTASSPVPLSVKPMDRSFPVEPAEHSAPRSSPTPKKALKPAAPIQKNEQLKDAAAMDSMVAPATPVAGALRQPTPAGKALPADPNTAPAASASSSQSQVAGAALAARNNNALRMDSEAYFRSAAGAAQISGIITDSTGATIPHAKITLTPSSGTAHRETLTDADGRFIIPSLQPGKYRLEISSLGFMTQVREVDLSTNQLARLDSKLAVGSATETVTVQAATPALDTESASMLSILPSRNAVQATVSSGTRAVALDASGKLFLSKNSGKHWKAIRGPWKKSALISLSLSPDKQFRVTSSQGSWLSSDGEHWHPQTKP